MPIIVLAIKFCPNHCPEDLKASLFETKQLIRPENDAYVDYFGKSYNRVRRFSSKLLAALKFQVRSNDSGLLTALNLVHEIHLGRRRKLPDDAPTEGGKNIPN